MTRKYRVSYAPEAYNDLGDIYSYIAFVLQEKRITSGLIKRIRKEVASLAVFPESYPAVDWEPWGSMGVRKMPVSHYVVYYLANIAEKAVTIIRIFYGGRNVENIVNTGKN